MRQTDRQTDRQTESETETDKNKDVELGADIDRQTDRHSHRQTSARFYQKQTASEAKAHQIYERGNQPHSAEGHHSQSAEWSHRDTYQAGTQGRMERLHVI